MKNACEGVLYPVDAASKIKTAFTSKPDSVLTTPLRNKEKRLLAYVVPHSSWQYSKEQIENVFNFISQSGQKSENTIFLLAPLHKGPINYDEEFKIYCPADGVLRGSDWEIKLSIPEEIKALPFIVQDDDVCTEEHSLEVIAPFIFKFFPQAQVGYLLATGESEKIEEITSIIGKNFPNSLVLLSNNEATDCAFMWKQLQL